MTDKTYKWVLLATTLVTIGALVTMYLLGHWFDRLVLVSLPWLVLILYGEERLTDEERKRIRESKKYKVLRKQKLDSHLYYIYVKDGKGSYELMEPSFSSLRYAKEYISRLEFKPYVTEEYEFDPEDLKT